EPNIIPPAHVRDEGDALSIRRPARPANLPRHIKLFDSQAARLDLRIGLRSNLLGIGNSFWHGQILGCGDRFGDDCAHEYDDSKECENAHKAGLVRMREMLMNDSEVAQQTLRGK